MRRTTRAPRPQPRIHSLPAWVLPALLLLVLAAHPAASRTSPSVTLTSTQSVSISNAPLSTTASSSGASTWTRSFTDSMSPSRSSDAATLTASVSSVDSSSASKSHSNEVFTTSRTSSGSSSTSPSPTAAVASSTRSASDTPSRTEYDSSTVSFSHTVTLMPRETPSLSATRSEVFTATVTMSQRTPTKSAASPTPTPTPTGSRSPSPTRIRPSETTTLTESVSSSDTLSPAESASNQTTKSATRHTGSSEGTPSPTLSLSPSNRSTATPSETISQTRSRGTVVRSATASASVQQRSHTVSDSRSLTQDVVSGTDSASHSPAASSSRPSQTVTDSAFTATPRRKPSCTRTGTPVVTSSASTSLSLMRSRSPSGPTQSATGSVEAASTSRSTSPSVSESRDPESATLSASWFPTRSQTRSVSPTEERRSNSRSASSSTSGSQDVASSSRTSSASQSSAPSATGTTSSTRSSTHSLSPLRDSMTWSDSLSQAESVSSTQGKTTRAAAGGSLTLSVPSRTASPTTASTTSASRTPTPTRSTTPSRRTPSHSGSRSLTKSAPSRTPSQSTQQTITATQTFSLGSPSPTTTRHRISATRDSSVTVSLTTTRTVSPPSSSATFTLLRGTLTNNNKSTTKTGTRATVTLRVTVTHTKLPTLTMTQTLVLHQRVPNALGSYLLAAFDFPNLAANGPCVAVVATLNVALIAWTVASVGHLIYMRYGLRVRPDSDAAHNAPATVVLLRENLYTGFIFPCHYHCRWIHAMTLLMHLIQMFFLITYILYSFQIQKGLLTGTPGLGIVAAVLGSAIAHVTRPLLDMGFYFVTYDRINLRKCQNAEGLTWSKWHDRAAAQAAQLRWQEEERARLVAEDAKLGVHLVKAAMMADIDPSSWRGEPQVLEQASADEVRVDLGDLMGDAVAARDDEDTGHGGGTQDGGGAPGDHVTVANVAALRELTLQADIDVPSSFAHQAGESPATAGADAAEEKTEAREGEVGWSTNLVSTIHDDAQRAAKLAAKWRNPAAQPWWGPVETQHLIVAAMVSLIFVALMSAFQNAAQRFDSTACNSPSAPLALALLIGVAFDALLVEPTHQALRVLWRYAMEHEGQVDYATSWKKRLSRLVADLSDPHPYRGEMRLWPEEAFQRGRYGTDEPPVDSVAEEDDHRTPSTAVSSAHRTEGEDLPESPA